MRLFIGIFFLVGLSACAAVPADPWGWLDDSEQQSWKEITINGNGREIKFSVPDRLKSGGQHVRAWPEIDKRRDQLSIDLLAENLHKPAYRVAEFVWDEYWGGFYKKGNYDFSLDIWIWYNEEESHLLDLSGEERIQQRMDFWIERRAGSDWAAVKQREYFFSKYWIRPYENHHGGTWVVENQPQITADHEIYFIPISDHHEIKFSFFVREKRYELKEDPEWQKRRWDMVQQIMSTVSIDPNPFPDD